VNCPSSRKNILEEAAFHHISASGPKSADRSGSTLPSFFLFKILHLTFASVRVIRGSISFSAGGKRFLTTKGTKITKFSDIFIFVSFVLSVVDSIIF
jgi:hypothetical protein